VQEFLPATLVRTQFKPGQSQGAVRIDSLVKRRGFELAVRFWGSDGTRFSFFAATIAASSLASTETPKRDRQFRIPFAPPTSHCEPVCALRAAA